jgi:peptide/nickel transport system ATP-binding protein
MSTEARKNSAVLQVRELSLVSRKSGRALLQGISFELAAGQVMGIMGPSGCGKSSLAMALMGLLPADLKLEGSIRFQGRELIGAAEPDWRALRGPGVAMVFQNPVTALNPVMRIGSQISAVLRRHRRLSRRQARQESVHWLERLGVSEPAFRLREYPHQLSGGTCQRVMLAMALGCVPDVLIADEPTSALDVTTQARLIEQLRELHRELGMAIVLISHDPGVIASLSDRTLVMDGGQIVEQANTLDLFSSPGHPVTETLIRSRYQSIV